MNHRRLPMAFGLALMFTMYLAHAATVRWVLHDVTFNDGTAAKGYFDIDTATHQIGDFAIITIDGPSINGNTYTNATADSFRNDMTFVPGLLLTDYFENNDSGCQIRLTPVVELDASGGNHVLMLDINGSVECNNCGFSRNITGGSLEGITDIIFSNGFGG
ncbi:MAG: hypothetical protein L0H70_08740 [Xanthomonadales bacterium]|nr:hypothetical protein [Xanthomonadales bacterium]